jgi:hypothetical protein
MKKEIVISAYDEDYSWIEKINDDIKKTIYRKGEINFIEGEIKLEPNVGRDVHTFFKHIYTNYENISDIIFFSQDYPFDHVENYIDIINGYEDFWLKESIVQFGGYYGFHWNSITIPTSRGGIMHTLHQSNQFGGNNKVLSCHSNGLPHDPNPNINVDIVWDVLFDHPKPNLYEFVPGGHFSITKEQIKIRSLDFYKKIVELLENDITMPWNIERLECYIFNKNYKSKL